MRYFFIRFQLIFVSVILLATFFMLMAMAQRHNYRWDLTKERIYSLSPETVDLLGQMQKDKIQVTGFYPDDLEREDFEIFLKQCQLHHRNFHYAFYDPNRSPQLAKQRNVREMYTAIVRFKNREERLFHPDEKAFANALLRLVNPKVIPICFVTGRGEAPMRGENETGLSVLRQSLEGKNYTLHEILLERDQVPAYCQIIVAAGPQQDWNAVDFQYVKQAFAEGRSILFLLDPMDPGTGNSFKEFFKSFGVRLGDDVVVDKMSRMVGGDFLVPFVNEYNSEHPVTALMETPTFFPVIRSVYPMPTSPDGITVTPIAFSGSGSWAETNLAALEKGEAAFESEKDFSGPITMSVAIQGRWPVKTDAPDAAVKPDGRMVVVGDSDFLKNAYVNVSGNEELGLRMIHWLSRDDRYIHVEKKPVDFQPLHLSNFQRVFVVAASLVVIPSFFFIIGCIHIIIRTKKA